MSTVYSGKTYVVGNNTTAYQISYNKRWKECGTNAEALGHWLFEPLIPEIENVPDGFKSRGYEILVSGVDFGGGFKSNDHPVLTVKGGGIKLMISEKFNRIFFRNAINNGLLLIESKDLPDHCQEGDTVKVEINHCIWCNGKEYDIPRMPENIFQIIEDGGLVKSMQKRNHCLK